MGKKSKDKAPKELTAEQINEQKEARTIEYYQVKVNDLTDKLERMKNKIELLMKENSSLAKAQAKFYTDKQDIVEFLNIKVGEHEKLITNLESKNKALEEDKKEQEAYYKGEIQALQASSQAEIESLTNQLSKYKVELLELSVFSQQKAEIDEQLKQFKLLIEKKEHDYRDTIHNLERKVLQDKSQMKREMLQKVNEAVANFRRVADQQMAETTKRAIRENMSITSQLKKMSQKTIDTMNENDRLTEQIRKLKMSYELQSEAEKELSKRNNANQKVIKMLVEKLKESDHLLAQTFEYMQESEAQNAAHNDDGREYLTYEMIEEIKALQIEYNLLLERIGDLQTVGKDLAQVVREAATYREKYGDKLIISYFMATTTGIAKRIKELTDTEARESTSDGMKESDFRALEGTDPESVPEMPYSPEDGNHHSIIPSESNSHQSLATTRSHTPADDTRPSTRNSRGKPFLPHHAITVIPSKYKITNPHTTKIEKSFYKMIESRTNFKPIIQLEEGVIDVGTQTEELKFGPKVGTEYLLGEVRPWGKVSELLPKKGIGLYCPRVLKRVARTASPKGPKPAIESLRIGPPPAEKALRS